MAKQAIITHQILAFDIGGTSAKYAFVSSDGHITGRGQFRTAQMRCFDEFLQEVCLVVSHAQSIGVVKVGISSPGVYDTAGNCIGNVENLPFLSNKNIPTVLQQQYPNMQFTIGNDGVAAAMGEYYFGAAQDCPSFICVTLGTGIGGAMVIDGKPYLGHHFQSCEIGYTNYQNPQQYCEKKYSTKGILHYLAQKLHCDSVSGRMFTDKVERGETTCCQVFEEWIEGLGQLIANMVLIIDPAMVVVGGGISREQALLLPALTKAVQAHLPPAFADKCNLKMAQCGNDAGLLGAASFCDA